MPQEKPFEPCSTCKFWIEQGKNAMNLSAPKVGECHKGPPTALAVQVGPGQVQIMSAWPPTPANGGCGSHESKIETHAWGMADGAR